VNQLWANVQRLAHILAVLTRHSLSYALGERLDQWPRLARYLPPGNLAGPERLRTMLEEVGGTFIKLGQMLALQPDILPINYCNALFKLLDRITPFEYDAVEAAFQEYFGTSPRTIFDRFDPEPIATASIGQVYVAYLDERKLAVKVQRPSVQEDFAGDIRLMTAAVYCIKGLCLRKLYWMIEPLTEFVSWTKEELDFRFEARYMQALRRNAQDNEKEYIPDVVEEYSKERVLTLEFLEGITLLNYIRAIESGDELLLRRLHAEGFDPDRFARNIIDNFLNDAFRHGMFHADLHPANLMILRNSVVGYIDFGITGVLSPYLRRHLVGLTLAYSRGDLDGMYASFFKVSALDSDSDVDAFRQGLQRLSTEWYTMQGKERRLIKNITLVMLDLLKLSRETGVWPERDVIKYIRSAIAIDGLITRFAPGFDVGKYLELVCNRYLTWHERQQLFAFETLVDWSSANVSLLRDGAIRAAAMLERAASGEYTSPAVMRPAPILPSQRQAVHMAAVMFSIAVLMTVTQETVRFGVNLFTAEMLLMTVAAARFLQAIRNFI